MIPKYRAWDTLARKMIRELLLISYVRNEIIGKYENGSNSIPLKIGEEAILMQSTGIIDKNGQEIWEGDVVRMRSGALLQVKLHHGMFEPVCFYVSSVFEREGNVFENPELLENPDFREDDL